MGTEEMEGDRQTDRKTDRQTDIYLCVCQTPTASSLTTGFIFTHLSLPYPPGRLNVCVCVCV